MTVIFVNTIKKKKGRKEKKEKTYITPSPSPSKIDRHGLDNCLLSENLESDRKTRVSNVFKCHSIMIYTSTQCTMLHYREKEKN